MPNSTISPEVNRNLRSYLPDDLLGNPPATFQSWCHERDGIRSDSTAGDPSLRLGFGSDNGNGHFPADDNG
jgi:hypothetical protein